ncbi:hypothetical protein E8A74_19645 [Polyangium fumosum]|uniref:Uncharacterized protein n=1 Tax=Polyangium fumosum TaxID=889272 RepID=A0A4U1JD07_9BACT|nr:hypothetical protein E8A74_19645 [Polyangium fumosum]
MHWSTQTAPPPLLLLLLELDAVLPPPPPVPTSPPAPPPPVPTSPPEPPSPPEGWLPNSGRSEVAQAEKLTAKRPRTNQVTLAYFTSLWSESTRMPRSPQLSPCGSRQ